MKSLRRAGAASSNPFGAGLSALETDVARGGLAGRRNLARRGPGCYVSDVKHSPPLPAPRAPSHDLVRRGGRGALLGLWLILMASACGRKATVEDCEQIVRRIAELELTGVVPREELGAEVEQAQQNFRERALADCVGRRITERSLDCVANAKTPEAVIDECFD